MDNKILYFSDLEGTILRESDGDFDDSEFLMLVEELTKLGELTNSNIEIRLVSPIGFKRMNYIIDRIDRNIARYSKSSGKSQRVSLIEAAASSYDLENDIRSQRFLSKKIIELPKVDVRIGDPARDAKRKYVDLVLESTRPTENIVLSIYAGNGRNDVSAMKLIKYQKNGIIISPSNSRKEVKEISHISSENTDIKGIIDCINKFNSKIIQRNLNKSKDERC